jgi:hypothetical protein
MHTNHFHNLSPLGPPRPSVASRYPMYINHFHNLSPWDRHAPAWHRGALCIPSTSTT